MPHEFRKVRERERDFEVTSDNGQVTVSWATEFRKVSEKEREREREKHITSDNEQVMVSCAAEFTKVSERERERGHLWH